MGLCIVDFEHSGPHADISLMNLWNLCEGWVWVVFRRETKIEDNREVILWHLQGIFDEEKKAVEASHDETYLIGPIPTNTSLPLDRMEWVGSYFPRKR